MFDAALSSPKLRQIYDLWRELASDRVGPSRSALTLQRLKRAASWTFLVEVIDGGADFRFGFAGDEIMEFLRIPCASKTVSGMRNISFFATAENLFRRCVETGKPLVSGPTQTHYPNRTYLERQVLLLPLSEDGASVSGILGAFHTWKLGTNAHIAEPILAA